MKKTKDREGEKFEKMRKKHIRERINKEFKKLLKEKSLSYTNLNKKYPELYFFKRAILELRKKEYEIALLLLCSIIESIANKKRYDKYIDFYQWLKEERKLSNKRISEKRLDKLYKQYKKIYGSRYGFKQIILESYHRTFPTFACYSYKNIGRNSWTPIKLRKKKDIEKNFKKFIDKVYDKFRSPFTHWLTTFDFETNILSKISSNIDLGIKGININLLLEIAFKVIKENITLILNKNDRQRKT